MNAYAFSVSAACSSSGPEATTENRSARYIVRAPRPEAAADVARQLFRADLARGGLTPLEGVAATEVLTAPTDRFTRL